MIEFALIWTKSYEGSFCKKCAIQQRNQQIYLRFECHILYLGGLNELILIKIIM